MFWPEILFFIFEFEQKFASSFGKKVQINTQVHQFLISTMLLMCGTGMLKYMGRVYLWLETVSYSYVQHRSDYVYLTACFLPAEVKKDK